MAHIGGSRTLVPFRFLEDTLRDASHGVARENLTVEVFALTFAAAVALLHGCFMVASWLLPKVSSSRFKGSHESDDRRSDLISWPTSPLANRRLAVVRGLHSCCHQSSARMGIAPRVPKLERSVSHQTGRTKYVLRERGRAGEGGGGGYRERP